MADDRIVEGLAPLGFQWPAADPFLFCVHHDDHYPAGNDALGPAASLAGRALGQDFEGKDGWRMYHGRTVPGFPGHPHRGFETVTIVRQGFIDHSDSLGATARFGAGDVQWLTAGRGIVHSEMFPLVAPDRPNPLELFQIWLNLPRADKMVDPYFTMLWREEIAKHVARDGDGRTTEVNVVAGRLGDVTPPPPPPNSWAARPDSDVAIWTIKMAPGARDRAARRRRGDAGARPRRERAAPLARAADRRAGDRVRSVRHEQPRRDPAGDARLSADALRGVAVRLRGPGASARRRALRPSRRRARRAALTRRGAAFTATARAGKVEA